ncbi:hypothetical protein ACK330_14885 [Aeromonas taiwanensis]|uniref:hypothetical protein n=1 Tax=Aeromonas taiwanensis TaxID=633417 RepID=UPI0039892E2F
MEECKSESQRRFLDAGPEWPPRLVWRGSAPLPMGWVRTAGKNPEFFLKGEELRPIYRLGGDYCHKGRKKKLKSHEKTPLTKHIRHKTKESLSELKINFNSLGEKS